MNRVRNDIRCDTINIREGAILPQTQVLVKAGVSYTDDGPNLVVSDGFQTFDVGANLPGSMLIFRPGYTGASNVVFGDWEALCAKLPAMEAPKYIYFDPSLISSATPITIPVGDWDMTGVTWIRNVSGMNATTLRTVINVADGTTLNGLEGISGPLLVNYTSNVQPAIVFTQTAQSDNAAFVISNYAAVICSGTSPFIGITTTNTFRLVLQNNGLLGDTTAVVIEIASGTLAAELFSGSELTFGSVSGAGNLTIYPKTADNLFPVPIVAGFAGVAGTVLIQNAQVARCPNVYIRTVAPGANDDTLDGYKIGDIWMDTVGITYYVASSVAQGAANWVAN